MPLCGGTGDLEVFGMHRDRVWRQKNDAISGRFGD